MTLDLTVGLTTAQTTVWRQDVRDGPCQYQFPDDTFINRILPLQWQVELLTASTRNSLAKINSESDFLTSIR